MLYLWWQLISAHAYLSGLGLFLVLHRYACASVILPNLFWVPNIYQELFVRQK